MQRVEVSLNAIYQRTLESRMMENYQVRFGGGCALKAHGVQSPEMATPVKLSSQPGTESCVVIGNEHHEA